MNDVASLLSRFIDEWNAGERPAVESYLARTEGEADRRELGEQISFFLEWAPTPRYSDSAMDELLAEPAVAVAANALAGERSAWSELLPRLRAQTGLSIRELAQRLLEKAQIGSEGTEKAAAYIEQMEAGRLDSSSLSRRVLSSLSELLGISEPDLRGTGQWLSPASAALWRREGAEQERTSEELDLLADALAARAPGERRDEVDELFFGRE